MHVVGRGDVDRVHRGIGKQRLDRVVPRAAVLGGEGIGLFLTPASGGNESAGLGDFEPLSELPGDAPGS